MKIKSIHTWLQSLPLKKAYSIAYKTISSTEIIFFEIQLENGIKGIGAANPFAEVVGETPAQAHFNLQSDFVHRIIGKDIRHFQGIIDEMHKHFPHAPGTVAAIDIALHDAFCKYLQISVVELYGQKTGPLPTSITIGIKDLPEMMEDATAYFKDGFRVLKIKTGLNVEEDIERVAKLSETFKGKMNIRVDANQGYTLEQLQYFIKHTADFYVELIEQPLPAANEMELLELSASDRKKLCADESLLDTGKAMQLAQYPQPFGIFNIKLMKCGGIRAASAIAIIAKHAGIDLFWGCNDESIVSISAALHIAYACSNTKYLDLDGSFDLSGDAVTDGFLLKDGYMYFAPGTGLGVQYK